MRHHHTHLKALIGQTILSVTLACPILHAQKDDQVIAHKTRTNTLEQAQAILDTITSPPQLASSEPAFPFHRKTQPKAEQEPQPQEIQPEPEPTVVASDSVILRAMSERFKPTGSLIKSDKRLLVLPGGNLISEGQKIPLTVRGKQYNILIEKVQKDGYTLRLKDITLERKFTNIQTDSINID